MTSAVPRSPRAVSSPAALSPSGTVQRALDALAGPLALRLSGRRDRAVVLLYHRVRPEPDPAYPPLAPGAFEATLDAVLSAYEVVPYREVAARVAASKSVRGLAAITFDDGYRCFLDHAYPILRRRGLPATHFLVSQCVATGRPTWNWRLGRALAGRPTVERAVTKRDVGAMSADDRDAWLDHAEAARPVLGPSPPMLSVDDLDRVDRDLVEWGAHTGTHASLGLLPDIDVEREVGQSADALAEWLGEPVASFSYPNGSYSPSAVAAVQRAGFASAAAVEQRAATPLDSVWAIPRFDVNVASAPRVRLEVAGVTGWLRRLSQPS